VKLSSIFNYIKNIILGPAKIRLNSIKLQNKYGGAAPKPFDIIWVDPKKIDCIIRPSFKNNKRLGTEFGTFIVSGNWDIELYDDGKGLKKIKDLDVYKLTEEIIYDDGSSSNLNGNIKFNNLNKQKKHIKKLYKKIDTEGFKMQRDMSKKDRNRNLYSGLIPPEFDEVRIAITRDGEFVLDDGRHRLCVAKLLKIKYIPVRVIARHEQWQNIRTNIYNWSKNKKNKNIDSYKNHPDIINMMSNNYV